MNDNSLPATSSLIDASGQPRFGHFDSPLADLGVKHFSYFNDMDKPASALAKHFHFKQFQFVSINTGRYIIGLAIADIRYVGSAFCYLYDVESNQLIENSWLRPPGFGYQMSPSPMQGLARIGSKGSCIRIDICQGIWQVTIDTPAIQAELSLTPADKSQAMAMASPTGYNGWTYTQKHNSLTVSGNLHLNGKEESLERALAGYDFSAGYMRRETSWRWASINAHTPCGSLGLNLAAGVNETGCHENAFWLNGVRHYLPAVHFDFQRLGGNSDKPWHIYSDNGQVDLTFSRLNQRSEKLNLWLIKINFRQFIGHIDGIIRDDKNREITISNTLGLTEDHFARW